MAQVIAGGVKGLTIAGLSKMAATHHREAAEEVKRERGRLWDRIQSGEIVRVGPGILSPREKGEPVSVYTARQAAWREHCEAVGELVRYAHRLRKVVRTVEVVVLMDDGLPCELRVWLTDRVKSAAAMPKAA